MRLLPMGIRQQMEDAQFLMPRRTGPRKTNRNPDEFKIKAVRLADQPE
jgi:hypothetical protein